MHPLVKHLEEKLLPEFEKVAEKIRQEISNVYIEVYSDTVGSSTQYQGYGFWIECIFTSDYRETENVGLNVGLGYLITTPRIYADVAWGYPSGEGEASFCDWNGIFPNDGMIVTNEILEDLYKDLPRLYEALFEALKRRKPINE